MKVYVSWLKEYLQKEITIKEIIVILLENGFECCHVNDNVIDVEIPLNRADCLSVCGLAQELNNCIKKPCLIRKKF